MRRMFSAATLILSAAFLALLTGCPQTVSESETPTPLLAEEPVAEETDAEQEGSEVDWKLTSAAFGNGERIPEKHTADGADVSPPLTWTAAPTDTQELVLICDDPDAPVGTWNHWIVYGLAPDVTSLEEGVDRSPSVSDPGLKQGLTSFNKVGYWGPAPPPGKAHRYQFTLYAVSKELDLGPGAGKEEVLSAMKGNIIARTMLEGTYSR